MAVPKLQNVETALEIYYSCHELGNKEISTLFGTKTFSVISRLKKKAKEQMDLEKTPVWDARTVNTAAAFRAWGLDIKDLENRYKKLTALNLMKAK